MPDGLFRVSNWCIDSRAPGPKSVADITFTVCVPCSEQYSIQPVETRSTGCVTVIVSVRTSVLRLNRDTLLAPYSDTYRLSPLMATAIGLYSPVTNTVFVAAPSGSAIFISLPVPGAVSVTGPVPVSAV